MSHTPLARSQVATAIDGTPWRLLFKRIVAWVPVDSLSDAVSRASVAVAACGEDADAHLRVEVRADRLELALRTASLGAITERDVDLSRRVAAALTADGATLVHRLPDGAHGVQTFEIAIDAVDIGSVVPFWRAVLGYADEPSPGSDPDAIIDPAGQGPDIWFQQMDSPRLQRNRIHFDVTVAHDEAQGRIDAALSAGGTLVSDSRARAFWVLADPEGNEVCVCTWQDRD